MCFFLVLHLAHDQDLIVVVRQAVAGDRHRLARRGELKRVGQGGRPPDELEAVRCLRRRPSPRNCSNASGCLSWCRAGSRSEARYFPFDASRPWRLWPRGAAGRHSLPPPPASNPPPPPWLPESWLPESWLPELVVPRVVAGVARVVAGVARVVAGVAPIARTCARKKSRTERHDSPRHRTASRRTVRRPGARRRRCRRCHGRGRSPPARGPSWARRTGSRSGRTGPAPRARRNSCASCRCRRSMGRHSSRRGRGDVKEPKKSWTPDQKPPACGSLSGSDHGGRLKGVMLVDAPPGSGAVVGEENREPIWSNRPGAVGSAGPPPRAAPGPRSMGRHSSRRGRGDVKEPKKSWTPDQKPPACGSLSGAGAATTGDAWKASGRADCWLPSWSGAAGAVPPVPKSVFSSPAGS